MTLMSVEELEDKLNEAMRLRANYNDIVVEVLHEVRKRGLTLEWDNVEYSGKYFLIKEEEK